MDLLIVIGVLVLQPLIALLYLAIFGRLAVKFVFEGTGGWVDDRIEKGKEAAKDLR